VCDLASHGVIQQRVVAGPGGYSAERPLSVEPVLADEVYEHILSVFRQHSRSMERNPQTYAGMGEEARRHVIRDALNTDYTGAGMA